MMNKLINKNDKVIDRAIVTLNEWYVYTYNPFKASSTGKIHPRISQIVLSMVDIKKEKQKECRVSQVPTLVSLGNISRHNFSGNLGWETT